jgi:hypothetical protein
MHQIDDRFDVLHRRMLQNAMAQVENVTRATARAAQNIMDALFDFRERSKEQSGIKIPLNRDIMPKSSPAIVQGNAPVQADHIPTGTLHKQKESRSICPEMDHRHILCIGGRQNSPGIRQHKIFVILRAERTHPRVEDLHSLRTGPDLGHQIF